MRKIILILLFTGLIWIQAGCAPLNPLGGNETNTPRSTSLALSSLEQSCSLLTSHDLAGFFATHTETILPKPQINPVDHPVFSTSDASGMETACVYYSFHLPGSHAEIALQVNYWLDLPASASAQQAWDRAWSAFAAQAQTLPGIAEAAFYQNGQLSFKKDDVYVTLQAIEDDWNLNGSTDADKQLEMEKQLALDVLSHMK